MSDHDDRDGHACDAHAYEEGRPTPAQDLALARRAFERDRDAKHALHHVACALAVDPEMPDALALADEVLGSMPDALAVLTLGRDAYFGTVALRAHALRRMGRLEEALELLLAVIGTRPDVPFSSWLARWTDDETLRTVAPERIASAIEGALRRLEDAPVEPRLRALAHPPLASLARRALAIHPSHPALGLVASRALRIAGEVDDAVAIARDVDARSPSYISAVLVGGALRARGDLEGALAAFRTALAREPADLAIRLDVGDLLLELRRDDEAARAYDEVLAKQPAHPWALPSMRYARWLETGGDPAHRDALEQLAETDDHGRARALVDAITPYLGYLPGRPESSIAAIRAAIDAGSPPRALGLSSLEAPSALAAVRRVVRERWGVDISITTSVPDPDPRLPLEPIAFPAWRYDGHDASPALPPPSAAMAAQVASIASRRYHVIEWTRLAQQAAPSLGVGAIEGLIGAMVHPIEGPAIMPPWDWTFRCQIAAALLLAFVDGGWGESGRRRALRSLALGPTDWTTTAAIVAMTQLAHEEPAARDEIDAIFAQLASSKVTPIVHMCVHAPLAHCRLQLPDLDDAKLARLRAIRADLERG